MILHRLLNYLKLSGFRCIQVLSQCLPVIKGNVLTRVKDEKQVGYEIFLRLLVTRGLLRFDEFRLSITPCHKGNGEREKERETERGGGREKERAMYHGSRAR